MIHLLIGLLDNYTYETTLLRISTRLLQGDVHSLLSQRYRQSRKGIALRASRCSSCNRLLQNGRNPSITAFQCRHAFHSSCLRREIKQCIRCQPTPIIAEPEQDDSTVPNQVKSFVECNCYFSNSLSFSRSSCQFLSCHLLSWIRSTRQESDCPLHYRTYSSDTQIFIQYETFSIKLFKLLTYYCKIRLECACYV
jgi:hypothetical protein